MDITPLNSDTCPAEPGFFNHTLWNEYRKEHHILHHGALPAEHSRSSMYSLFRRAAMAHGFGSEYQSELRKLVGEKWTHSWVIWALAMPGTFILGAIAQLVLRIIFGNLRLAERRHTRERLWNYAFYKFIFIFGVVNVESMEEMIIWVAWFILLGYVHFFIVLSRDRCEYMTFSPVPSSNTHGRIVALLLSIIVFAIIVIGVSGYLCWTGLFHTALFTLAEGILILLSSWLILVKYGYHHFRQRKNMTVWEKRNGTFYYLNFFIEMGIVLVDLFHHGHMMCQVCNLSASSLVIAAQIRYLFADLVSKISRHRNYMNIRQRLQESYPSASEEEIKHNDSVCSICWDAMEQARKLSCGHLFHETCLLSWLEQDISCPICRVALTSVINLPNRRRLGLDEDEGARFFHFQGSRFNRWLPNVSVTVSHAHHDHNDNDSIERMAEQVRQIFPNVPHFAVIRDLLETGSTETTIENILAGSIDLSQPHVAVSEPSDATAPPLTTMNIGGIMRQIPDTPEACRALQIQRKETLVYEARKKYLDKIAKEKANAP